MSENAVPQEQGGVLDFSKVVTKGLSGILSINADFTQHQLLTPFAVPGMSDAMVIVNDGIGGHTFAPKALFATVSTPVGVPAVIPNNVPTVALTLSVPGAGLWVFTANCNQDPFAAPLTSQSNVILFNGASTIGYSSHGFGGTANQGDAHSLISILLACAGGENITMQIHQENSGAGAYNYNAFLQGIRLGNL